MKTYLVKNQFYPLLLLVEAETPSEAFANSTVDEQPLENWIVDNEDLVKKGFITMRETKGIFKGSIWELSKS